jgi:hypothetical protein
LFDLLSDEKRVDIYVGLLERWKDVVGLWDVLKGMSSTSPTYSNSRLLRYSLVPDASSFDVQRLVLPKFSSVRFLALFAEPRTELEIFLLNQNWTGPEPTEPVLSVRFQFGSGSN